LAGIVCGLGIPTVLSHPVRAKENDPENEETLDESYLVMGLTGMARAQGWFDAHWGAGILAGYYLCRENPLRNATKAAIKRQLDAVVRKRPGQFVPFSRERSDEALIGEVPKALHPAIEGGLRAHGHAVIFASLSTKALREVPQMAQPAIIQGLCGLSHQIAKGRPQAPLDPMYVYPDSNAMVQATLDNLLRFKDLLGRPSVRRPNFTHMVTHTEALLNLESMGYRELAEMGHAGQKTHISPSVPTFDASEVEVQCTATLEGVSSPEFWNDNTNQERWNRKWNVNDNPNGDWIAAGHLFKVLYSYHRLIKHIPDKKKIELCSSILLERYVDPSVQGG
jgi:hypothetical protein